MITAKELSFISTWESKAPYPGIAYAEKAADYLKTAFEDYNKFYRNKEYDIILSNGEQVLFEILSRNLCHMFGVNYKNLSGDYFQRFREEVLGIYGNVQSYTLLEEIINHIDDVLKFDCDNRSKVLNYYRIMIKCSIFERLSDFSKFNFGVINFDKATYQKNSGYNFSGNSRKFLYVQSNEVVSPYFMMGILPDISVGGRRLSRKICG